MAYSGSFNRTISGTTVPPATFGGESELEMGFKANASRGMIVVSGAAPQEQRLRQPNGIKTEGSYLD